MATKTYLFKPEKKLIKQGFIMQDDKEQIVYEAKMIKNSIFSGMKYEFTNHLTNKTEEHKVGHTVTIESSSGNFVDFLSTRSYFKYDGKKIWDYLHELGIRIDSKMNGAKVGMKYDITLKGEEFATLQMSNPNGGKILTSAYVYDVTVDEANLDLAFLVTFAIAKTEQTYYN